MFGDLYIKMTRNTELESIRFK